MMNMQCATPVSSHHLADRWAAACAASSSPHASLADKERLVVLAEAATSQGQTMRRAKESLVDMESQFYLLEDRCRAEVLRGEKLEEQLRACCRLLGFHSSSELGALDLSVAPPSDPSSTDARYARPWSNTVRHIACGSSLPRARPHAAESAGDTGNLPGQAGCKRRRLKEGGPLARTPSLEIHDGESLCG